MARQTGKEPNTGVIVAYGTLAAAIGVALGAFAAHGLRPVLAADAYALFDTGVRYQMYHAFALVAAGLAGKFWGAERPGSFVAAAWLFGAGILLFSGSLYALALAGARWPGLITPVGGLCFLAGWLVLFVAIRRGCRAAGAGH